MASFIAYYGKKRSRLENREHEFLELLSNNASETQIADAAEVVRAAHIRALKEKRQKFAPSEKNSALYKQIEDAIRWWTNSPNQEVIDGYRNPRRRRKMSSAVRRAAND